MVRAETDWEAKERPGYRLTRRQSEGLDRLMSQATAFQGVEVKDEMSSSAAKQMAELDW
jgi:hypothetical protein